MKRRWRVGRIILAFLLLNLAGLAFYVWPKGPRWTIPFDKMAGVNFTTVAMERPVGFDLKQGLLFTTKHLLDNKGFELHGFDLASGELKVNMPIPAEDINPAYLPDWSALLSGDCSKLVCRNRSGSIIQVFDVMQKCRCLLTITTPNAFVDSISFSSNGDLLAFRNYDDIQIWNCVECKNQKHLTMPPDARERTLNTTVRFPHGPDGMQFSDNKQFLAVAGDTSGIVVFDVESGQAIGQCSDAWIPHFFPDNKTILALPNRLFSGDLTWYEIVGKNFSPLKRNTGGVSKGLLIGTSKHRLLTSRHDFHDKAGLPSWIPTYIREWINSIYWDFNRLFPIMSWDIETGQLVDEFSISFKLSLLSYVSSDGQYLAIEDAYELCLWDIPPRRSTRCWLVCSSVMLLAFWIAWPRKLKLA